MMTWRQMAWSLSAPVLFTMVGFWIVPETPFWLAEKERTGEALKALAWLRDGHETKEEIKELEEKAAGKKQTNSIRDKLVSQLNVARSRQFWKPFLVAEPLVLLYSCSGVSVMTFYLVTIFEESGSSVDKLQASLVVGCLRLIMAFFSSLVLMKVRRRPLFLSTAILVSFSQMCLGLFNYFNINPEYEQYIDNVRWIPLVSILCIYGGTQLGYSPVLKVRYQGTEPLILSYNVSDHCE